MAKNGWKWMEKDGNGWKLLERLKWLDMAGFSWKWKWLEMARMTKNGWK